jgi:hypothetical protein
MKLIRGYVVALGVLVLTGCASPEPVADAGEQVTLPPSIAPDDSATIRRAVCVGVLSTSDGLDCPGCDVDAATVAGWMPDRPVTLLLDSAATIAGLKAAIRAANEDMAPGDLLTVSISSHGTQCPDRNGDEEDGYDEGVVLFDGTWWDDDIWDFLSTLRPCRLELFTDTCHAEGNWRKLGRAVTFGFGFQPRYVQLELNLGDQRRDAWAGQIVQFAGCREDSYSYGAADVGGTWTQTLHRKLTPGIRRDAWFATAAADMPTRQEPALSVYNASEEFLEGAVFL